MERAVLTERVKVEMKEMQKCLINCYISCDIQWTPAQSHQHGGSQACVSERARVDIGENKTPACDHNVRVPTEVCTLLKKRLFLDSPYRFISIISIRLLWDTT